MVGQRRIWCDGMQYCGTWCDRVEKGRNWWDRLFHAYVLITCQIVSCICANHLSDCVMHMC